jgi:aryl-alcohol dehydrogenase-like predicted oxidoreductase
VLGRALGDDRDAVILCTKVGLLKTPAARIAARRAGAPAGSERCYEAGYVRGAAERSLRRLRTDRLDILLLHSPTVTDLESRAAWPALEGLRERGAVTRFGVSCEDAASARVAVGLPGVECIELPWNADHPEALDAIRDEARRRGIVILANRVLGNAVGDAATAALRGALAADGLDIVLVGMSRPDHVTRNVAAAAGVQQIQRER